MNFLSDADGIAQLLDTWAKKRENKHRSTTNMGTALAVDGFVVEIIKPNAADLNGQEVTAYRNRKRFWGLISQIRSSPEEGDPCSSLMLIQYQ
jgi:hypothetical protein